MPRNYHFAVAVGIDTYPKLLRLTSSVKDATEFCLWLTAPDGGDLPDENVRLIASPATLPSDPFDARPVKDEIDRALRDFGAESGTRIGSRLYFYFAGHGFGATFDDVGMLMAPASMTTLKFNIGLRAYRDYFHETGLFDEVVFLVDCCRDNAQGVETESPVFAKTPVPDRAQQVVDFVVLAAGYGKQAFAPVVGATGERRGLLTQAVLEALRGAPAALDPLGRITASTLAAYVKDRVKKLADDDKLRQDPDIPSSPELVFGKVNLASMRRLKVHIVAPPELTGELILRDGNHTELGRRDVNLAREAAPWEIDVLPNNRYDIENPQSDLVVVLNPAKATQEPYVFRFPRP